MTQENVHTMAVTILDSFGGFKLSDVMAVVGEPCPARALMLLLLEAMDVHHNGIDRLYAMHGRGCARYSSLARTDWTTGLYLYRSEGHLSKRSIASTRN